MIIDETRMLAFKAYGEQLINNDQALSKLDPFRYAFDQIRYWCGDIGAEYPRFVHTRDNNL